MLRFGRVLWEFNISSPADQEEFAYVEQLSKCKALYFETFSCWFLSSLVSYSNDLLKSHIALLQFNKCIFLSCTISLGSFYNDGDNAPSKMFLENEKLHICDHFSIILEHFNIDCKFYNVGEVRFNVSNKVFFTIRPRCFLIIRDSLLVVTSLSIPYSRLRHRSEPLCRSCAK